MTYAIDAEFQIYRLKLLENLRHRNPDLFAREYKFQKNVIKGKEDDAKKEYNALGYGVIILEETFDAFGNERPSLSAIFVKK